MKTLIRNLRVGFCLSVAVTLLSPALFVGASPQPTLKMQIMPPECTVDTVDDGMGPVQVITCPPGTIPLEETEESGSIIATPSEASSIISQRLDLPNDTLVLLDLLDELRESGMAVELPDEITALRDAQDTATNSQRESVASQQNTFIVTVLVATSTLLVLIGGMYSHAITSTASQIFQRIKVRKK
jgi:hypothetical protein